ncbi:MAG: AMP-binding protein [Lachnospiraceae bacterium]|nr:AMP-binding protein [Lachnospiraceae bacterium]MDD3616194.1 AMP-binding protein [Lachnospiraceae bacterium]
MKRVNFGETIRRTAFDGLDKLKGGSLKKLKEVNKREIVEGVTDEYVERRIHTLLEYSKRNSSFYKSYWEAQELKEFPVMNKGDYNNFFQDVMCDGYKDAQKGKNVYALSTSGSTGTPFTVYCDGDKMNRVNMNFISVMELNGFRMGMKRGEFRVWIPGKNTISKWKSFKNNLIMIDISNMGDEAMAGICEKIEKQQIQVLVCYSSAITALTGYLKKKNVDISNWAVEMVFAMGEALPDATYQAVVDIFGFSPVRSYGNNENGFIAIQLDEDSEYTIDLYNFHVEMLKMDSNEPVKEGELGRIVVTDYYNRAFPMIRYDTGDTGIMRTYYDENGRKHAKFTEIYGRRGSLMYNTKGEPLSIHVFMNVLIHLEGIVHQAKCIQWEKKRYELLLNADKRVINEAEVVSSYRKYLGDDAVIDVTYVDEIPIQASGKTMVCENRCPDYQ